MLTEPSRALRLHLLFRFFRGVAWDIGCAVTAFLKQEKLQFCKLVGDSPSFVREVRSDNTGYTEIRITVCRLYEEQQIDTCALSNISFDQYT